MHSEFPDFDLSGAFPFDGDVRGGHIPPSAAAPLTLSADAPFAYIGRGLSLDEFTTYTQTYDFGSVLPDYIVLHHTAVPSASWARYPSGAVWDAGEAGLSDQAVYTKRLGQLAALMRFYRDTRGWDRGPHLFIDDRWIWLFTPMAEIGIHAARGNSYLAAGKLHYSIGIEVVGYYEHTVWPDKVARLVGGAIAALKQRLKTFDYLDGPWAGKIGAHRMYNKPSCPGAAITPSYYMPLLRQSFITTTTTTPAAPGAPVVRSFVVKPNAAANIRGGKSAATKYLGLLSGGDPWAGEVKHGQRVTIKGLGATDEWVCNARGCVWRGLLDEVPS